MNSTEIFDNQYKKYTGIVYEIKDNIYKLFPSIINTKTKKFLLYSGFGRRNNSSIFQILFKPPYYCFSFCGSSDPINIDDITWKNIDTIKMLKQFEYIQNSDSFSIQEIIDYKYINIEELKKIHGYVNEYHSLVDRSNTSSNRIIKVDIENLDIFIIVSAYRYSIQFGSVKNNWGGIDNITEFEAEVEEENAIKIKETIDTINNNYKSKIILLEELNSRITNDLKYFKTYNKLKQK